MMLLRVIKFQINSKKAKKQMFLLIVEDIEIKTKSKTKKRIKKSMSCVKII